MTTKARKFSSTLAVLGAGKMGGILLQAFLKHGVVLRKQLLATVKHRDKAAKLSKTLGLKVTTDNVAAVRRASIVILGLKPQLMDEVLEEIRPHVRRDQLFISIAASVPTHYIEERLPEKSAVIRAMPNTPAMVGAGVTALASGRHVKPHHLDTARLLFDTVGKSVVLDEKHMDAVTALSASGPAYFFIILESLAEAGVKVGLPRDLAMLLASQTALGSAKMALETGHHPALLKDAVTTPAGCTIDGIMELEEGGLRVTLIKAVVKATQRARELLFAS